MQLDNEAARANRDARKARDPEAFRRTIRMQKLRSRYRNRIDEAIADTQEKLMMLQQIRTEIAP